MLEQVNISPTPHERLPEQGQADRGKAAAATQTRLVDPDKTSD